MLRDVKGVIENCAAQQTALVVLSAGGFEAPAVADLLLSLGCDGAISSQGGGNRIAEFNNALLESSGTEVHDWTPFNAKWLASPKATEFLNRALNLLQTEFDGSYLSLIWDRNTARLLPFWNVAFDRADILPRYVFVMGDPAEVAGDLHNHFEIEHRAGNLIWLRSVLDAEAHSRGRLRAFVDATRLSQDPAANMNLLGETLQLTFPLDVQTIVASENIWLRRLLEMIASNKDKLASGASRPHTSEWVSVTHEILKDWTVNGEAGDTRIVLDALRDAFDEAIPVFPKASEESVAKSSKVRELEQKLESLQAEIRSVQESARQGQEDAKESIIKADMRTREAVEARKEIQKDLNGRVSHLESELAQRIAEGDETWKLLNEARSEVHSAKQALDNSIEAACLEISELQKSSADSAEALEESQGQLRARYSEIVTLTRMLATETSSARKFEQTAERLARISQALERGGTTGAFAGLLKRVIPWSWHVRKIKRYLEREGLFDSDAYLGANPDIQDAGVDPLKHYLSHGAREGRPLGID